MDIYREELYLRSLGVGVITAAITFLFSVLSERESMTELELLYMVTPFIILYVLSIGHGIILNRDIVGCLKCKQKNAVRDETKDTVIDAIIYSAIVSFSGVIFLVMAIIMGIFAGELKIGLMDSISLLFINSVGYIVSSFVGYIVGILMAEGFHLVHRKMFKRRS